MSDWQQQQGDEEHRWTLERGLTRMEEQVKRGTALQQILKAERQAAVPAETELELEHEH